MERQRDRPVHRAALPDATPFAPLFATCCHSADSGTGRKCRAAGASITHGQKHMRPVRTQDRCAAPHWQNLPATHLKASQRGHQRAGISVQCIGLELVCVHCFWGEAHSAVHQFPATGIVSKRNAAVSPVAGATTKAGQPSKAVAVHCIKQDLKTGLCTVPATPVRSLLQLSRAQLGKGLAKQPLKLKSLFSIRACLGYGCYRRVRRTSAHGGPGFPVRAGLDERVRKRTSVSSKAQIGHTSRPQCLRPASWESRIWQPRRQRRPRCASAERGISA